METKKNLKFAEDESELTTLDVQDQQKQVVNTENDFNTGQSTMSSVSIPQRLSL